MTEKLLQYIWQHQYFQRNDLVTAQGDRLQIIAQGTLNTNQGPDFLSAKVRLGDTTWAGNIELHLLCSDWHRHSHETDDNFRNIILHVVWKNDETGDKKVALPMLELQPRVSVLLLRQFEDWMNNTSFVPCENSLSIVSDLVWLKWKERLLVERLQRKSVYILQLFKKSGNHWEETFWWMISRNFGIRINADAFEAIAMSLPVKLLSRHKSQIHQLEAILFGQAGLLDAKFDEAYPRMLQKEFRFLQKKYGLRKTFASLKFMRMRPSSFPTIRLAQLAMLIMRSTHLFSKIKEVVSLAALKDFLSVSANDYWHYHYRFDEESHYKVKHLGDDMIGNILLNTILPILYAYGAHNGENRYCTRVLNWIEEVEAENNRITRGWVALGISNASAFDSQALLELKTQYCDYKRCVECAIGNDILTRIK